MDNKEIKQLMKTKWANHFTPEQHNQIQVGLDNNLDVSIYAKSKFSYF